MDPSPFSQSSVQVVWIQFQPKPAREYYCCSLCRKGPRFQRLRTMVVLSLRRRNLRSCPDCVESLLGAGVIEVGTRCSSNTNSPDHLSPEDRKSTRLNSSHPSISYAVFCL